MEAQKSNVDPAGVGAKPKSVSLVERAKLTSRRLRHIAGVVEYRSALAPAQPVDSVTALKPVGPRPARAGGRGMSRIKLSALLMVALPTLLAILYFGLFASNQYVSEVRLAIRSMDQKSKDNLGSLLANPLNIGAGQSDLYLVSNYLNSREIVQHLQTQMDLKALYSTKEADMLSRLKSDATMDDLIEYWRKMLASGVDSPSGVLTVEVRAFAPEHALKITQALVARSEALINGISERAYQDAVSFSTQELQRNEERVRVIRISLSQYRDKVGVINPAQTADVAITAIARLQDERMRIEQEIATRRGLQNSNSPVLVNLRTRMQTLDQQIASLQGQVTSRDQQRTTDPALSSVIAKFDELQTELQFAQKSYEAALANHEKAQAEAARQHFFLVPFVQPMLAETPKYPRRIVNTILVFLASFAFWGIAVLTTASIRDHAL